MSLFFPGLGFLFLRDLFPRNSANSSVSTAIIVETSTTRFLTRMRFRELLPKPASNSTSNSGVLNLIPRKRPQRRPRGPRKVACDRCRKLKSKCDAEQPKCIPCRQRGLECHYGSPALTTKDGEEKVKSSEMEQQQQQQLFQSTCEQLIYALGHREAAEADAILELIRQGLSVESIMKTVTESDLFMQLHVVPETRYRFTFPTGPEFPSHLKISDNVYLRSVVYEVTLATSEGSQARANGWFNDQLHPEYFKPYVAASPADPRFDDLTPSMWTYVSVDDDLMRELLCHFFHHEYQWFGCFHKDHFLDDMLSGSTRCCSTLLVNSVLALACGCYPAIPDRTEYWNPKSLGYQFLAEAKRLLELEKDAPTSLTTLQAAINISISLNMQSMDKQGVLYAVQALAMAQELELFGPLTHLPNERIRDSYAFTAWSFYFCLFAYHFMEPPLLREPPASALPENTLNSEFYPESWVQYPLSKTLRSTDHESLFKAQVHLMILINHFSTRVFGERGSQKPAPSLELLQEHVTQLLHWYSSLPITLSPSRIVYPAQIKLHLLYHNVMINVCRLLVENPESYTGLIGRDTPQSLLGDSEACFETLLRLYYLRHGFEGPDTYLTHHLTTLAFKTIREQKSLSRFSTQCQERRDTLIFAIKGLEDQGKSFHLPRDVLKAVQSEMDPRDLETLGKYIETQRDDESWDQLQTRHLQAQWPLNVQRITDHPDDQRLGVLMKKYLDLSNEEQPPGNGKVSTASSLSLRIDGRK